jgi:hypothetical protein
MSKTQWRFRPSEVQRLVKAAQSMGLMVSGIEVGTGKIRILINEPQAPSLESEGAAA